MLVSMITVYGVSKPKEGKVHTINPLRDVRICICPSDKEVVFAESICRGMAKQFPGELYYCWDNQRALAIFSCLISEEEHRDMKYAEILQINSQQHLKEDALRSCQIRGHRMFSVWEETKKGAVTECSNCGMSVFIVYNPQPTEMHISGEALGINCKDSRLE